MSEKHQEVVDMAWEMLSMLFLNFNFHVRINKLIMISSYYIRGITGMWSQHSF